MGYNAQIFHLVVGRIHLSVLLTGFNSGMELLKDVVVGGEILETAKEVYVVQFGGRIFVFQVTGICKANVFAEQFATFQTLFFVLTILEKSGLFTIKNQCKKSAFSTNAQSRFASVVVNSVLGPPRLARHP